MRSSPLSDLEYDCNGRSVKAAVLCELRDQRAIPAKRDGQPSPGAWSGASLAVQSLLYLRCPISDRGPMRAAFAI